MTDYNLKVTPTAVPVATSNPMSNAGGQPASVPPVQSRTRQIAPPTTYNPESGLVEPVPGGWTGKEGEAVPKPEPKAAEGQPATTRHEQWKKEQEAARAKREADKGKKAAEAQPLAKDFLKKGDLMGAAKALGLSAAEFRELAQNALLTVPTPDKELTPEQKRAADEEAFRTEVKAFKAEQEQFRAQTIRSSYIKDKIAPAIADADKFEFIHNEGLEKMGAYIYDFMNAHFQKTKEELNPADVAEEIEKQLEANFTAAIGKARKMKKAAKFFGAVEEAAPVALGEMPEDVDEQIRQDTRFPERAIAQLREAPMSSRFPARSEEIEEPSPPVRTAPRQAVIRRENGSGPHVPFALLSREERLAQLDAENRAAGSGSV